MLKRKRFLEYSFLSLGLILFVVFVAKAVAQNVTQGYETDANLQQGTIVQIKTDDATKVIPLSQDAETNMLGVVVAANDAPVALSNNTTTKQVYVATYGQYDVLVSDQNGAIKAGDTVTVSALDGVGMKADASRQTVLGKAIESFDGHSNVQGTATLTTSSGKKTVDVGRIAVNINVAHNPAYKPVTQTDGVPKFLASIARVLTNKPVGAVRIYSGLIVFILTILIVGVVLYSGVRNGMTAIGRNPLAKKTITRNLIQVILISVIVALAGLIAVYLLLKL